MSTKLYLMSLMSLISFVVKSEEMSVRLIEPASTIIIARVSGIVSNVPLKRGDHVTDNSLILSIKEGIHSKDIIASHKGIIKNYGGAIKEGHLINLGDFVAEILDSRIIGVLSPQRNSLSLFTEGETYCCLLVDNLTLKILINHYRKVGGSTTYFFSGITKESALLNVLTELPSRQLEISFKHQNN